MEVPVGTGVVLTGQGSISPEALPPASSNPNRAFGISSVLENLMSLALDLCLLTLSLVRLQKITAVPVLFLPFPLYLQQSQAALHFCTLIHLSTLFNYKDAWFKDGKFEALLVCGSVLFHPPLGLRFTAKSLGKGWVTTLFAILVYMYDWNSAVFLFIQEQSCKRLGISNHSMMRTEMWKTLLKQAAPTWMDLFS